MRTRRGGSAARVVLAAIVVGGVSPVRAEERAVPRPAKVITPEGAKRRKVGASAGDGARPHLGRSSAFQRTWGVDIVGVRRVSSGLMLRFDYRVVDPERAAALTDRRARPYLIDEATQTALAVPAMENIGELRQMAPLETNRTYFMIFGNPGGLVRRGGRVTLVVGNLRAGLVVE